NLMLRRFHGILRGNGYVAKCFVTVDSDGAEYMSDDGVTPPVPDGKYDLEVNGVHRRAVRANGQWSASEY
ncbi:MAG: hypothetical protein ACRD9W_17240, partial [Terriglobia bacterium]